MSVEITVRGLYEMLLQQLMSHVQWTTHSYNIERVFSGLLLPTTVWILHNTALTAGRTVRTCQCLASVGYICALNNLCDHSALNNTETWPKHSYFSLVRTPRHVLSSASPPVQYLFISLAVSQEARSKPQWVCCRDGRLCSQWKRREDLATGITASSYFVMQHAANILMCTEMWLYGLGRILREHIFSSSEKAHTVLSSTLGQYFHGLGLVQSLQTHVMVCADWCIWWDHIACELMSLSQLQHC